MTPADAREKLDEIYISIGSNEIECTDEILREIDVLERLANPTIAIREAEREKWLKFNSKCDCGSCWDCASERGGCPADV
jgi:hypothetical protein